MNLRVDLILETEQRSGSAVNVQSIKRIATVVGPAVAILLLAVLVWKFIGVQHEHRILSAEWDMTEPQRDAADRQLKAFQVNVRILKELEGWEKARPAWNKQLDGLIRVVPTTIQLDTMRVSQNLQINEKKNLPSRIFVLDLRGKAVGETAEDSVRQFEQSLRNRAPFKTGVASVKVPVFGADPSKDADRNDRIFGINCAYKQMVFE